MQTPLEKTTTPAMDKRGQTLEGREEQQENRKMNLVLAWLSLAVVVPTVVGGMIFTRLNTDTKRQPVPHVPTPASSSPLPEAAKAQQEFDRIDQDRQQRETEDRLDRIDR